MNTSIVFEINSNSLTIFIRSSYLDVPIRSHILINIKCIIVSPCILRQMNGTFLHKTNWPEGAAFQAASAAGAATPGPAGGHGAQEEHGAVSEREVRG